MKLLLVTHYFPSHGGGVEIVADVLARQMLQSEPDLRIAWFASSGDAAPVCAPRMSTHAARASNQIERLLGVPYPVWRLREMGRLWRAVGRSDAVHLHEYTYMGNLAAAFFCRVRGTPLMVTQHIGGVPFERRVLRFVLELANRTLGKNVLNRARAVLFISDEVRRYFQERGVTRETQMVPNGVDSAIFHAASDAEKQALRKQEGFGSNRRIVLFAGRFVEKKGVRLLLEIALERADCDWIFAGRGPLDPELLHPDLPSHIRTVRDRRGTSLAALYRLADLLVLPSVGEGFPLVVQEALACGTPALVESALGDASPVAREWLYLETLGRADDRQRWNARISKLLEETESESTRLRRAKFAASVWSWQQCAAAYLQVMQTIADEKRKDERK